jgi:hypothetical protein
MITVHTSLLPFNAATLAIQSGFSRVPDNSRKHPQHSQAARFQTLLIHFIGTTSYSAAIPEFDIEVLP